MSQKKIKLFSIKRILGFDNYVRLGEEDKWNEALEYVKEAKDQILFSIPMILTSVSYFLILIFSVMFAGQLGELELAGATLANSWATVTGFAFMTGLSGSLETLCGQGYGAKLYKILGIYLQSSCIISFIFSLIITILWLYTEPILILLNQDPQISSMTALYMKYLIPGLFAYGFLQNILRFLQTQSVVIPLVLFSVIPVCIHIGTTYILVHCTSLGFRGAPMAASISLWISVLSLVTYVKYSKEFEHTWDGFSFESFRYIVLNLKLALPSAAMQCLEDWAFESLVIIAGWMPNPQITTSLTAMSVNTGAVAYMFAYGLSAAASTRISNELGAGRSTKAKTGAAIALKLSILLAFTLVFALFVGHNVWTKLFSNSTVITREFASMVPFLAFSITLDSMQGVLSGVARGCGWQNLAAYANFVSFYFIGMPVACLLGFKFQLYAKGLWIGLICGLAFQVSTLLTIMTRMKWVKVESLMVVDKELEALGI